MISTKNSLLVLTLITFPLSAGAAPEPVADAECSHAALNSGERLIRLIFRGSRQTRSEQRCIELVEQKRRYTKNDQRFYKTRMTDQEFRQNNLTQPHNSDVWTSIIENVSQLESNDAKRDAADHNLSGFTVLKPE